MASQPASVQFLCNGEPVSVAVRSPQTTLLDALRERGLTGAKEGCAEGECGACMVAVVANGPHGSEYHPINSCLMLLPMAAGHEIYTVEGLASNGELGEAQRAMAAAGGSQCGYCTPGFVVSLFAEQYRPTRDGACETKALGGNLCRCTGYRPIADAAHALGPAPDDRFKRRLAAAAPSLEPYTIEGFARPSTIDDCLVLLAQNPAPRLVAGGSDLAVDANLRHPKWSRLVSVEAIPELQELSETHTSIRIGAALSLADLEARWTSAPPVMREWFELFASPPIRNRATLGGNLATASPIGDSAPLLLAMDATVHLAGAERRRTRPIASFFTGYRRTALRPGEMLTTIEIPKPLPNRLAFYKVSKRRLDDISTVAVAIGMDVDAGGVVRRARFAFGGVGATPMRLVDAERSVEGSAWNENAVERVQEIIGRTLAPMSDHRGSRDYRLQVCQSLIQKFWWESR
jgi:xanthine dehydrogenase small subunit